MNDQSVRNSLNQKSKFICKGVSVSIEVAPFFYAGGLGTAVKQSVDALNRSGHEIVIIAPYLFDEKHSDKFIVANELETKYKNNIHDKASNCQIYVYKKDQENNPTTIFAVKDDWICTTLKNRYGAYANQPACDPKKDECFVCTLLAFNNVAAELIIKLQNRFDNRFNNNFDINFDINTIMVHDWLTATTLSILHQRHHQFYHTRHKVFFLHNKYDRLLQPASVEKILDFPPSYLGNPKTFSPLADGIHLADIVFANMFFCKSLMNESTSKPNPYDNSDLKPAADVLIEKNKLSRIIELHHCIGDIFNPKINQSIIQLPSSVDLSFSNTINDDDTNSFNTFKNNNKAKILTEYNLEPSQEEQIVFCWVGRLDITQKGLLIFLSKIDFLLSNPHTRIIILGMLPKDHTKLKSALIEIKDKFPGKLFIDPEKTKPYPAETVAKVYAGSDFLLMPSIYEPFGLVHLEAMSMGCIPIVHAIDGIRATVEDHDPKRQIKKQHNPLNKTTAITMDFENTHEYEIFIKEKIKNISTENMPIEDLMSFHKDKNNPTTDKITTSFEDALHRALKLNAHDRAEIGLCGIRTSINQHNGKHIVNQYYEPGLKKLQRIHSANMARYIYASPKTKLLSDQPIENDLVVFGADEWSSALASLALSQHNKTPFTILIDGEWGRGKTTLLKQIEIKLENEGVKAQQTSRPFYRKVETLWFNAWKYSTSGEDSMLASLTFTLLEKISKNTKKITDIKNNSEKDLREEISALCTSVRKNGLQFMKSITPLLELIPVYGGTVGKIVDAANTFIDNTKETAKTTTPDQKPEQVTSERSFYGVFEDVFKYTVNNILRQGESDDTNSVLAIFLDDLDRCSPEKILEALETIKLFIDFKGVCFFLGVDYNRVRDACEIRYEHNAQQFLEKFMHVQITMPPINEESFSDFISELIEDSDIKDVIDNKYLDAIVSIPKLRNPRRAKRFLNDLSVRTAAIESSHFRELNDTEKVQKKKKLKNALLEYQLLKEVMEQELWPSITYNLASFNAFLKNNKVDHLTALERASDELKANIDKLYNNNNNNSIIWSLPIASLTDLNEQDRNMLIDGIFC